ncbi:hypothetical protein E9529_17845 [Blastococcus sp. KM273128]|uniref:hypothetical protein n=1 Tax=Blastococcus sp. KM273128 TaxID=2570314 RepID=UPI001F2C8957|nr:hypothetical protein [Blastococcus sp. KM273128]MCF6746103.1 hypothetical protein [Blastococcus sp. KM273128]
MPPDRQDRGRAAAVVSAVLAFLATLPLLWAALVIWALGGLDSEAAGERFLALLPLAAALLLLAGGVLLLLRRTWSVLAGGAGLAAVLAGWVLVRALADGGEVIAGPAALLLAGLLVALALSASPSVRRRTRR